MAVKSIPTQPVPYTIDGRAYEFEYQSWRLPGGVPEVKVRETATRDVIGYVHQLPSGWYIPATRITYARVGDVVRALLTCPVPTPQFDRGGV